MKKALKELTVNAKKVTDVKAIQTIGDYIIENKYKVSDREFKVIIKRMYKEGVEMTKERIDMIYTKAVKPAKTIKQSNKLEGVKEMGKNTIEVAQGTAVKIMELVEKIAVKHKVEVSATTADDLFEMFNDAGVLVAGGEGVEEFLIAQEKAIEELIIKSVESEVSSDPNVSGLVHDELLGSITKGGNTSDTFMLAIFNGYKRRGAIYKTYIENTEAYFGGKIEMAAYFRGLTGKKGHVVKTSAYVTADSIRLVGNALEIAITAAAKFTNKYAFQVPAEAIDVVALRPDELGDNLVKSYFGNLVKESKAKMNGGN